MVTRTKKIFVGGLSAQSTLEDVKNYFEQFGKVRKKDKEELFELALKGCCPAYLVKLTFNQPIDQNLLMLLGVILSDLSLGELVTGFVIMCVQMLPLYKRKVLRTYTRMSKFDQGSSEVSFISD